MFRIVFIILGCLISILLINEPTSAQEETATQMWANVILSFPKSKHLYLEVDFEGQKQTCNGPRYAVLYATPLVEYYPNK